ncbi:hypothetical protein VNO78_08303 [Psophocarpus tetragonolobus]|uniref:Uncharacterized protein n=1 Tax=Psophocarpus tetragonolobus TaxID=3891 RepID=A0AAN9XT94_PSOTE
MWKSLYDFPQSFVSSNFSVNVSLTYDDEDLSVWEYEANRWFIQNNDTNILKENHDTRYVVVKFVILVLILVLELQRAVEYHITYFAKQSCSAINLVLFSGLVLLQRILPCMVQLKENLEALVNEGCQFRPQLLYYRQTDLLFGFPQWQCMNFLLVDVITNQSFLTTRSSLSCTEIGAEISLATYEALVSIMRVLASTYFAHSCCLVEESEQLFPETEGRPHLDYMGVYFIQNINDLLGFRVLARTQRVVLLDIATIFLFVMRYISLLPYYLIFGL